MFDNVNKNVGVSDEFMRQFNVLQLADDSVILAEDETAFQWEALSLASYSEEKNLVINKKETKYISTHEIPQHEAMKTNNDLTIEAVKPREGYNWLGLWLTHTNDISELISFNINKKMYAIRRFYEWLADNEETPFLIKVKVLYSCLFASILYSCETWSDISGKISDELLKIEKSLLKRILGVKDRITDNIILCEYNRSDITSAITDRQYHFFNKLLSLTNEDTSVKGVIDLYDGYTQEHQNLGILNYYKNLRETTTKKLMMNEKIPCETQNQQCAVDT